MLQHVDKKDAVITRLRQSGDHRQLLGIAAKDLTITTRLGLRGGNFVEFNAVHCALFLADQAFPRVVGPAPDVQAM